VSWFGSFDRCMHLRLIRFENWCVYILRRQNDECSSLEQTIFQICVQDQKYQFAFYAARIKSMLREKATTPFDSSCWGYYHTNMLRKESNVQNAEIDRKWVLTVKVACRLSSSTNCYYKWQSIPFSDYYKDQSQVMASKIITRRSARYWTSWNQIVTIV